VLQQYRVLPFVELAVVAVATVPPVPLLLWGVATPRRGPRCYGAAEVRVGFHVEKHLRVLGFYLFRFDWLVRSRSALIGPAVTRRGGYPAFHGGAVARGPVAVEGIEVGRGGGDVLLLATVRLVAMGFRLGSVLLHLVVGFRVLREFKLQFQWWKRPFRFFLR